MTTVAKREHGGDGGAELSPELVRRFAQMAMAIPEDDGSGLERIIEQVLSASSLEEIDAPWDVTKADKLAGKMLKITSLKRQPSSYRGGLGIFLVAGYTDMDTGEQSVLTTSSTSVVAQLARAFHLGGLPVYCELVIADRPTEDGYYPHHLKMLAQPRGE